MEALQHEHLEHEQRMKARPAAGTFGFASDGTLDERSEDLPLHQLAHAHQRRLEGRDIKGLNELIEESRVAVGNETCHAPVCLNPRLLATF